MASGPSDKAVGAATWHWPDENEPEPRSLAQAVLNAAHDPALGLDRSVCLRDVVEWLQAQPETRYLAGWGWAEELWLKFGEDDHG